MFKNFQEGVVSDKGIEHQLVDRFGRVFTYLRVAVNEVCNLRCVYCMPEKIAKRPANHQLMNKEDVLRVIRVATQLGIEKVRFTGGEPLLHPDLLYIVEQTAQTKGVDSVHLTTNGVFLAAKARELKAAGLSGINISLDTLRADRFLELTRRPMLDRVLHAIETVLDLGFDRVKINAVAMRGGTEDELADYVEMTRHRDLTVRFIELMPFDCAQVWKTGRFYHAERLVADLKQRFPDMIDARGSKTETSVFRRPGFKGKIAVIPAYSRDLCGSCTRVRLTADGKIRNCLYSPREFDLIEMMRAGCGDEALAEVLKSAVAQKKIDGWEAQREEGEDRKSMSRIGG